ncbi:MAG: tail fiber domain-containing protein [Duodenibacillus sp.]
MGVLVTNNAWGQLSIPVTAASTTLLLTGGQGDRFPSATEGVSYFYATLVDSANNIEIVKCTARQADTLTVVRGVDNTEARAFLEGSRVELRPCAALLNDKVGRDELELSMARLETTLRNEDDKTYELFSQDLDKVREDYATIKYVDNKFDDFTKDAAKSYLTTEEAKKQYVPVAGGTMTGGLKVKSSEGITITGGDLNISGGASISGTLRADTVRTTSDVREKNSIVPFLEGEGAALAKAIRPVHFKWNKDGSPDVGMIAQEVQKVLPAVVGDDGGRLAINYAGLVAVAFAAIQDLQKQIEELKCRES